MMVYPNASFSFRHEEDYGRAVVAAYTQMSAGCGGDLTAHVRMLVDQAGGKAFLRPRSELLEYLSSFDEEDAARLPTVSCTSRFDPDEHILVAKNVRLFRFLDDRTAASLFSGARVASTSPGVAVLWWGAT